MNKNWLAIISTLHCMAFLVLKAEPVGTQFVKRNSKYDMKKDSLATFHDADLFSLDTLAGLGLGKRSSAPLISSLQPSSINSNGNDHGFRFLDTPRFSRNSELSAQIFDNEFKPASDPHGNRQFNYPQGLFPKRFNFQMAGQREEIPTGL